MDDIKAEIAQMDDQAAHEHLETLQKEIAYVEPIWNEARQESGNMVSYGMIWKFFHPGDLVLREDDLGNQWLLVLVEVAYRYSKIKSMKIGKAEGKETSFDAWFLTWNKVDDSLTKQHVKFTCPEFSGKQHITSLPVHPIRYQEDTVRQSIKGALTKRGRRWQELITAASICQHHCGLAFIQEARQAMDEKFQVSHSGLIHPAKTDYCVRL